MGHQHHIDPAVPERHHLAEAPQRQVRIGAAVDEQPSPGWRRDEDRVALPDVERGDVQPAVGPAEEGDDQQRHAEHGGNAQRMKGDVRQASAASRRRGIRVR